MRTAPFVFTSLVLTLGIVGASGAEPRVAPTTGSTPPKTVPTIALPVHPLPVPRATPPGPARGSVVDFKISGFTPTTKGRIDIVGTGQCRMRADIYDLNRPSPAQNPVMSKPFLPAVPLPQSIPDIGPLPDGSYRAYLIGYDDDLCPIQGPDKKAGGWYVDFKVGTGKPSGGSNGGQPATNPPPGGGGGGGGSKPANGKLVSMQVPGGSFAEDEAQKLQVNGQGGCAFDLAISNKSYGGSYEQTWPVQPMGLDSGATLYNGTHFGTLAQGSYHAQATAKNGCTGSAGVDFKVTEKTSTKTVKGAPTLSFDQKPKSGSAFSKSKDSNIWFKVQVPQSVKDEPSASCCDIEFDFLNAYGGWEALPNSPFNDSSFGLAVSQQAGVVPKSVSGFTQGTKWRVKVRAYKYKTQFEWSDWLEFTVDQN
jgi:hypothetical protein